MVNATVWNEYIHERENPDVADIYPDGIHHTVASALTGEGYDTKTATLQDEGCGLTTSTLEETDVLLWWSHTANDQVPDEIAQRVVDHVLDGMGFIALHSAINSKPFQQLMGTSCSIKWRHGGETERVWVADPGHPIADGLGEYFELPKTEMYGEPFDVPEPDRTVFISWFEGGEVFRSGLCYRRGRGRIFTFRPGHEIYPIYTDETVQQVLSNAVQWAVPTEGATVRTGKVDPIESIGKEPE